MVRSQLPISVVRRTGSMMSLAIPYCQTRSRRVGSAQGAIVGRDRDDLGRRRAKPLFDKFGSSHFHKDRRDRQSVLGVILRAVETTPRCGLCGDRLNRGDLFAARTCVAGGNVSISSRCEQSASKPRDGTREAGGHGLIPSR